MLKACMKGRVLGKREREEGKRVSGWDEGRKDVYQDE
jgi:hypothetical protein